MLYPANSHVSVKPQFAPARPRTCSVSYSRCIKNTASIGTVKGSKPLVKKANTFTELVDLIRLEVNKYPGFDIKNNLDVSRVLEILNNFDSSKQFDQEHDWRKYALFDDKRYTRNLIDDGNGQYNLLLLCWGPGQSSPVHDHSDCHCIVKVMQNEILETRYKFPAKRHGIPQRLEQTSETMLQENQAVYVNDQMGIHKVANPYPADSGINCVSLHLYSPPIKFCHTFEGNGKSRMGKCGTYSVGGKRNLASSAGLFSPNWFDCGL